MAKEIKYKIIERAPDDILTEDDLNMFGQDGWELIFIKIGGYLSWGHSSENYVYYFKKLI